MFKLVTFDFTGTLMRFRTSPAQLYGNVAQMYGLKINDPGLLQSRFRDAYKAVAKEHANFGAASGMPWFQWWRQVVKLTLTTSGVQEGPALEAVAAHLIKMYSTTKAWEVIPGVEEVLSSLAKTGQRMAIVSNIDPRVNTILQEAGLQHHFEFVLSSYEVGIAKPDRRIFETAMAAAGVEDPKQCCHVGDTFATDYAGARNAGWNAILVNKLQGQTEPQHWCSDIKQLTNMLSLKQT